MENSFSQYFGLHRYNVASIAQKHVATLQFDYSNDGDALPIWPILFAVFTVPFPALRNNSLFFYHFSATVNYLFLFDFFSTSDFTPRKVWSLHKLIVEIVTKEVNFQAERKVKNGKRRKWNAAVPCNFIANSFLYARMCMWIHFYSMDSVTKNDERNGIKQERQRARDVSLGRY